jgi:hypothetical protein
MESARRILGASVGGGDVQGKKTQVGPVAVSRPHIPPLALLNEPCECYVVMVE